MRLQGAVPVETDVVADRHQVVFRDLGGVHVDAPADLRAHRPEEPWQVGRPQQHVEEKGTGQVLLHRRDEFRAPHGAAPQGILSGAITSHDGPFDTHGHHRGHDA